jgi:hypothetical protein
VGSFVRYPFPSFLRQGRKYAGAILKNIILARRPFRTPIGLGRSAHRFGGNGQCIVRVEQYLSQHCILAKIIYSYICCFLQISSTLVTAQGIVAIIVVDCIFYLRGTLTHIADRCVDRCTLSESTRPNRSPRCPIW